MEVAEASLWGTVWGSPLLPSAHRVLWCNRAGSVPSWEESLACPPGIWAGLSLLGMLSTPAARWGGQDANPSLAVEPSAPACSVLVQAEVPRLLPAPAGNGASISGGTSLSPGRAGGQCPPVAVAPSAGRVCRGQLLPPAQSTVSMRSWGTKTAFPACIPAWIPACIPTHIPA